MIKTVGSALRVGSGGIEALINISVFLEDQKMSPDVSPASEAFFRRFHTRRGNPRIGAAVIVEMNQIHPERVFGFSVPLLLKNQIADDGADGGGRRRIGSFQQTS